MLHTPHQHKALTENLARALDPTDIYDWLVTDGFYPESYVLPPCFHVCNNPSFGKVFFPLTPKGFNPRTVDLEKVHFPKTELTDRTFGIIYPEIHSDIAYEIAISWNTLMDTLFHPDNKVCSYSFPIPVNAKTPGIIGKLRSGRMIYEFIEMAENDLASIAYRYQYLIKSDIKNFYPSIYTHSIAWAIHGKSFIRKSSERTNYTHLGNRLDKLFQSANDGCTNGIPIGPAVSDLISEIVLSGVDRIISNELSANDAVIVRFKDDYRILCNDEATGKKLIKKLQSALKEYNLELHDEKTRQYRLPDGLYREWRSLYHAANPFPKKFYSYERFKETYLSFLAIDKQCPGTGVIDRFLADIVMKNGRLRLKIDTRNLSKVISLLLMLARPRIKAFPKTLGIIEAIVKTPIGKTQSAAIVGYLEELLKSVCLAEQDNKYLIMWIVYFIRANDLEPFLTSPLMFKDKIVQSVYTSQSTLFKSCKNFKLFVGVKKRAKVITMLEHLDVFKPQ